MIQCQENDIYECSSTTTPVPSFKEFPADILLEIFETAIDVSDEDVFDRMNPNASLQLKYPSTHPRLNIPLVCKCWRALSRSYVWRTLVLVSQPQVETVLQQFQLDPQLPLLVRRLVISEQIATTGMLQILELCRSIRVLNYTTHQLSQPAFEVVTQMPHLKSLGIQFLTVLHNGAAKPWTRATLAKLSGRLTSLHFRCPPIYHRIFLPELCEMDIPHIRLANNNSWLAYSWEDRNATPLLRISKNPKIHRLEVTGMVEAALKSFQREYNGVEDKEWPKNIWYSLASDESVSLQKMRSIGVTNYTAETSGALNGENSSPQYNWRPF